MTRWDAGRAEGGAVARAIVAAAGRIGLQAKPDRSGGGPPPDQSAQRTQDDSETTFRRVLDAAPDGVAVGTRDRFAYANPALVRLLGCSDMQQVTSAPLWSYLHPDDRGIARRLVGRALRTGRPQPLISLRLVRVDGTVVPVELRVMVVLFEGESMLLGVGRDLTERRRLQTQVIQADRRAAVGTLAAGVAHEINNPLAYVSLNLEYLMRALPRFSGDRAELERLSERLAEAQHGARRVSAIVGDLKAFSRSEPDEQGPIDVVRVMREAIKIARPRFGPSLELVEHYEENLAPVRGSAARLEQVFVNLLVNAAQAQADKSDEPSIVTVVIGRQHERIVVEVRDSGHGIPPHLVDHVFDPFFTTKPRGSGTGLGLPICHSIVASMGGDITVDSVPNEGANFRVSLPALDLAEALPPGEPTPAQSASFRRRRARLLVIDDEPIVADTLMRTLSEDHDVTVATSANEALASLLAQEFDVVFCDLLMPGMSGMALYAELQARRPGLEKRLVFMTGGAFTPKAASFLESVPNQTISKPFDVDEIMRLVDETVCR